jgi:hypothetical protein
LRFEYEDQICREKWMDDFLQESLSFVSNAVARVAKTLEKALSSPTQGKPETV